MKIRFVRAIEPSERRSSVRIARGESQGQGWPCLARQGCAASGNAAFGNMRFATTLITLVTWTVLVGARASLSGEARARSGDLEGHTPNAIPLTERPSAPIAVTIDRIVP